MQAVAASRAIPDITDHHIEEDPAAGAEHTPQATRKETRTISIRTCATTAGVKDTWLDNVNSGCNPAGQQSIGSHHRQWPSGDDEPFNLHPVVKMNTVTQKTAVPKTYIKVEICNQIHKCLLDTGCDHSIIPRKLVPTVTLEPAPVDVKAANGSVINILGYMTKKFAIKGVPLKANLLVA